MFARLAALAALAAAFAGPALAGDAPLDAAYRAVSEAGETLRAEVDAAEAGRADNAELRGRLAAFAETASLAAAAIAAHDGPADLGCIYRGMAEDAARQARALDGTAGAALARIRLLGDDAVLVTPSGADQAADPYGDVAGAAPMTCPAGKLQPGEMAALFGAAD